MTIRGVNLPISVTQCNFLIDHLEGLNYTRPIDHRHATKNEDATRNALIGNGLIKYEMETPVGRPKATVLTDRGHDIIGKILEHYINNLIRAGVRSFDTAHPILKVRTHAAAPTPSP